MLTSGMVTGMYLFFPLAKLQVLLLAKLTTTSLVKTEHFKKKCCAPSLIKD